MRQGKQNKATGSKEILGASVALHSAYSVGKKIQNTGHSDFLFLDVQFS